MSAFDRYFHAPYSGLRPYLFTKVFLIMVALDTWLLMIGHAGRYGVADFNVAHFAWLGALSPVPTPALYVAVLLVAGLLALSIAILGVQRWAMALLFGLYTYSWAMSMLDSYQHHYFVSLIMLCMIFFPRLTLAEATSARASGFGFNLLGASISVLYVFTSVAKMDTQWCQGHTLQRISQAGRIFGPLAARLSEHGLSTSTFWSLVSTSVIPVELLIALGYALAVVQDVTERLWLRRSMLVFFAVAVSLHVGAEFLKLEIGWFSYYMLVLAATFLLPEPVYAFIVRALAPLAQWLARSPEAHAPAQQPQTFEVVLVSVCASGLVFGTAYLLDLPGARAAAIVAIVGLAALVTVALAKQRTSAARGSALALGFSALLMWGAIANTDVRWDYYRFLGGDLQRRGELQNALDAYVRGERYAPKGSSRRQSIDNLRRQLDQ